MTTTDITIPRQRDAHLSWHQGMLDRQRRKDELVRRLRDHVTCRRLLGRDTADLEEMIAQLTGVRR